MDILQVGEGYVTPRELHIEKRYIRTLNGQAVRNDKTIKQGTEVAITSIEQESNGEVWVRFTDGTYRYKVLKPKLLGMMRTIHAGFEFYLNGSSCRIRDLLTQSVVETVSVKDMTNYKEFLRWSEEKASTYKR